MKKTYECEYCGKVYDNEEDCLACEENCTKAREQEASKLSDYKKELEEKIKTRLELEKTIKELHKKSEVITTEICEIKAKVAKEFPNYMITTSTNEDGTIEVDIELIPEEKLTTQRVNAPNFFQILNDFINFI